MEVHADILKLFVERKEMTVFEDASYSLSGMEQSSVRFTGNDSCSLSGSYPNLRHALSGRILGRGGFGTVIACDELRCIKVQRRDEEQIIQEKKVYDLLNHDKKAHGFVAQMLDSGVLGDFCFLLLERLVIDLHHFIIQTKEQLHQIVFDVVCGLEFLHSHHIAHGDVKPHNLMLDLSGRVRLVDFGLAAHFELDEDPPGQKHRHVVYQPCSSLTHRGTLLYISEDSHRGVIPSRRSDLENLGWVIVDLMIRRQASNARTPTSLPWSGLKIKHQIMVQKIMAKNNLKSWLKKTLHGQSWSRIDAFFRGILELGYDSRPDYDALKKIFT